MQTSSRRRLTLTVAIAAVLPLTACAPADVEEADPAPPSPTPVTSSPEPSDDVELPREVAADLDAPWSVVFLGETALVSARDTGEILELTDDGARVVGTVPDLSTPNEAGLLGLAVDGDHLYAASTAADGNRVQRYPLSGEPGSYELGSPETIIDGMPSANVHNGGRIAFGPDGMLYVSVGDAGSPGLAQDPDSLAGKILRMTPDGDVPDDNPTDGSLVYSLGHRNVQGLAWADDGTMFASEFGADTWDELNVIEAGGNYGWPEIEGIGDDDRFIDPVQQWPTGEASPSGIAIANDTILIANLRGERLRAVPVEDPTSAEELHTGEYGRLRDVVVTPDGELWILTNNTDGRGAPEDGDDRIIAVELPSP